MQYGYSRTTRHFRDFKGVIDDILTYYINRKVSSVMPDLKSIKGVIDSALAEAMKDLKDLAPAFEKLSVELHDMKTMLGREHHYRTLKKDPPAQHARMVEQALAPKSQPATE